MADMITRCPKCSTAFRISEDLINSAKGVVRCGSCLNVFNAKEYLVAPTNKKQNNGIKGSSRPMSQVISDLEELAKTTRSVHKSATTQAPSAPAPDTKLKKPQAISPASSLKLKKPSSEGASLFERPPEPSQEAESEESSAVDEAWALELLKEESESDNQTLSHKSKNNNEKPNADKTESSNLSTEIHRNEDKQSNTPKSVTTSDRPNLNTAPSPATTQNIIDEKSNQPETLIDSIAAIEPESLDSLLKERQASLFQRIAWSSLTAIALLALIGQILWLQFYRLNQKEPYRSVYTLACSVIECEVPELLDRAKIQTSNLIIRSHPKEEDALVVDVIIKNTAHFEQRFPDLRLTFTNLKSQAMATRKLTPKEYLGGELTGHTMMPKDQAIHIGMEIVDPGPLAVSYSIAVEN